MREEIKLVADNFCFGGTLIYEEAFGCGHINTTYAVYFKYDNCPPRRYILQRINTSIFNPGELMENVVSVTAYLHELIESEGGDPLRETLTVVPTKDGKSYYTHDDGSCWRAYYFIEGTIAYQSVDSPEIFYNAGRAFGRFQKQLASFDADQLYESIKDFHNTGKRFTTLQAAAAADKCGRAALVSAELEFVRARKDDCFIVTSMLEKGQLPLRVTHNDTKLNNILMDASTNTAVCIIDLDTIMPGSVLYDFGDSIRFGASTALEDETDLDKVSMDLKLFESHARGFLEEAGSSITKDEIQLLPFSAKLLTLECGIRFLTDYLDGDTYFKTHHEGHNLERARNQFKLVADMEAKMDQMQSIISEIMK